MISLVALSVYLLILGVHDLIDLLPDLVPELAVGDGGLAEYNEIIIITLCCLRLDCLYNRFDGAVFFRDHIMNVTSNLTLG